MVGDPEGVAKRAAGLAALAGLRIPESGRAA